MKLSEGFLLLLYVYHRDRSSGGDVPDCMMMKCVSNI